MNLEDFVDVSEVLGAGVYLLIAAGEVVFVGKASRVMLTRIAAHRSGNVPSFLLPNIRFDRVLCRFIHPDRLDSTYAELVATYQPRHNFAPRVIPTATLERRL